LAVRFTQKIFPGVKTLGLYAMCLLLCIPLFTVRPS